MKKVIKISSLLIVLSIFISILNTSSTHIGDSDLTLTHLVSMNIANAEQTLTCYGTYSLGGTWVINKCFDCTQVANVNEYIIGSKSTCTK